MDSRFDHKYHTEGDIYYIFHIFIALPYSKCVLSPGPLKCPYQRWGFSTECVSKWFVRSLFFEKALTQCLHVYGFSPECLFKCHLKSHFVEKAFARCPHWYGLSPVCILKCPIRWIFFKKHCQIHCICMVLPQYEFRVCPLVLW